MTTTDHTEALGDPAEPASGPAGHGPDHRGPAATMGAAVREFVLVVAMALALSFVVKTWLFQAFFIPSGSMENTLRINDRVIVNKLVPSPMSLHRGDIVVFQDPGGWLPPATPVDRGPVLNAVNSALTFVGLLPDSSDDHLIKRVIGLPGDHVSCGADHVVKVNGVPLSEPYVYPGDVASTIEFNITVPAGRIWVMGDHRSDSEDSRYHDPQGTGAGGSVPISDVTGRAVAIVWPLDHATWLSDQPATFGTVPAPGATSSAPAAG